MAEEKKERIITVNLRKGVLKKPDWNRSKVLARIFRNLVKRQTKVEYVKISKDLNEKIWERGIRKPFNKLRVKIVQIDDKTVRAELVE